MKRLVFAALVATLVGSSSGCCLFDSALRMPSGLPDRPASAVLQYRRCNSGGCNQPGCQGARGCAAGGGCANGNIYGQGPGSQLIGGSGKHTPVPNDGPSTGAVAYPYYTSAARATSSQRIRAALAREPRAVVGSQYSVVSKYKRPGVPPWNAWPILFGLRTVIPIRRL